MLKQWQFLVGVAGVCVCLAGCSYPISNPEAVDVVMIHEKRQEIDQQILTLRTNMLNSRRAEYERGKISQLQLNQAQQAVDLAKLAVYRNELGMAPQVDGIAAGDAVVLRKYANYALRSFRRDAENGRVQWGDVWNAELRLLEIERQALPQYRVTNSIDFELAESSWLDDGSDDALKAMVDAEWSVLRKQ